jgi:hypothetical protein
MERCAMDALTKTDVRPAGTGRDGGRESVQRARPAATSTAAILALFLAVVAALTALAPEWPARAAALPSWLMGFWQTLLAPAAMLLLAAVLLDNTARPSNAWRTARGLVRALPALAVPTAVALAYVSLLFVAGALTPARAARLLTVAGLQVALSPATPFALACLALAALVLSADRREVRALSAVGSAIRRGAPCAAHAWSLAAPLLVTGVAAGAVAAAVFPAAMRGWGTAEAADAQAYNVYRSFFNYSVPADARLESRTGYGLGLRGLTLPPGGEGSLVIRLDRPPQSVVLLKADFYNRRQAESGGSLTDETFSNHLEVSAGDGAPFRTVTRDTSLGEIAGGRVLDLTPLLGEARVYRLRFSAHNTTSSEATVLPAFQVSTVVDEHAVPHFTFPVVAYAIAAAVAIHALCRVALPSLPAWPLGLTAGILVTAAARAASLVSPVDPAPLAEMATAAPVFNPHNPLDAEYALRAARGAAAVLVGLWAVGAASRRRPDAARAFLLTACLVVAAVATDARWQALVRVRYEFLLPDASGYQAIAAEFPSKMERYRLGRQSALLEHAYESGFGGRVSAAAVFYAAENNGREPGWPAALRLVYNLLGVSAFHTRLTSLGISVALAALTCWLGWRVLHPLAGLTGGLLFALNPAQIGNGVAGLREELVSLFFLGLVAGLFVGTRRGAPVRAGRLALVGTCAAGLVLVRADMLVLAVMAVTLGAVALRWDWREWVAAVCVMGVLSAPMYAGYAFTRLDPFYPGTYGATVNRNLEFPERMGTPGFPSPEAYAADWAAGPPISPMTYFFGYHTLPTFVEYSVRGFLRIFPDILFRDQLVLGGRPVALWLFIAGTAALLATRRWLIPFVVVLSLMPFYAFMAGVPNPWVFAPRYAHHTLPYATLAAGFAVWALPLWLAARYGSGRSPLRGRNVLSSPSPAGSAA